MINLASTAPIKSQYYPHIDKTFDKIKVDYLISRKEDALPYIENELKNTTNEHEIVEDLFILNQTIDNGTKDVNKMYPILSKFNNSKSADIQTFLAGIYRKTQIPEAYNALVEMLVKNSVNPPHASFDTNEEIGGAILSYFSNKK